MLNPGEILHTCLTMALNTSSCNSNDNENRNKEQIDWLERQLTNISDELQAMILDIESGLTIIDIGFFSGGDFEDRMADIQIQISNLKDRIRVLKEVTR